MHLFYGLNPLDKEWLQPKFVVPSLNCVLVCVPNALDVVIANQHELASVLKKVLLFAIVRFQFFFEWMEHRSALTKGSGHEHWACIAGFGG